jgi:hypothetical protein
VNCSKENGRNTTLQQSAKRRCRVGLPPLKRVSFSPKHAASTQPRLLDARNNVLSPFFCSFVALPGDAILQRLEVEGCVCIALSVILRRGRAYDVMPSAGNDETVVERGTEPAQRHITLGQQARCAKMGGGNNNTAIEIRRKEFMCDANPKGIMSHSHSHGRQNKARRSKRQSGPQTQTGNAETGPEGQQRPIQAPAYYDVLRLLHE